MDEIILVGAGGYASVCIDVIELSCQFNIAGIIEKDEELACVCLLVFLWKKGLPNDY